MKQEEKTSPGPPKVRRDTLAAVHRPLVPVHRRLRQDGHEVEASLGYTARPYFKEKKTFPCHGVPITAYSYLYCRHQLSAFKFPLWRAKVCNQW
jgi:hypothetical protein